MEQVLAEAVRRIRACTDARRVVLFGSRGRGEAGPASDYDLLVIADSDEPRYRRSAPLYATLAELPAEFDVVVYTPGEAEAWRDVSAAFVTRALQEGIVLYESQE